MTFYRLILFIFLISLTASHAAQNDSTLKLTQPQWKDLSEGIDYTETYKEQEQEKESDNSYNSSSSGSSSVDIGAFKYVLYVLMFALVVFIVIKLFGNFKNNSAVESKVVEIDALHEIEERMHEIDLEELLKQALEARNFRLALRLNFLIIIKLLSQSGKINWAKEKTNWEYHTELQDKLLADQFKEIIQNFELFWYGEHTFTELDYHSSEPVYRALQKKLKPHE
jgi:hypothetical protein